MEEGRPGHSTLLPSGLSALSVLSVVRFREPFCLPHISSGEILVDFVVQSAGIVAMNKAIDPFLAEVEAAALFAVENDELGVFPGAAGRSVPDFQGDAVLLGGATIVVENFAAGGIGASENQLGHLHRESALSSDQVKEGKKDGEHTLRSNRVVLTLIINVAVRAW
jgi:hypothetical protein